LYCRPSPQPFGGRGFELFQLELHLVEKPRLALAALAIEFASHLFDRELEMRNQCLGAGNMGRRPRKLCVAGAKQTLQPLDMIGKRISGARRQ
jgi:hypothetical protein